MSGKAVFVYTPCMEKYRFNESHPFNPTRLQATVSMLTAKGLLRQEDIALPRCPSMEELLMAHDADYIDAVRELSDESYEHRDMSCFGLGTEDNPAFRGMHEAAAVVVGGTLAAGEMIMEGSADHALNIAGGLHHAGRRQAAGFCIYNDVNVAIRFLCRRYHIRVVYIDTDSHHGDGVQWEFYQDPNVLTISLHETGRYLFPGTGGIEERGKGEGFGYCVNVPLAPFTDDRSFLQCFQEVVPPLVEIFQPDLIVSQNGCDGHYLDDFTHFSLTMDAYREIPRLVHSLAHQCTGGKWLVLGGGGYDPCRVVARAWTLLWAEVVGRPVSGEIPADWRAQWQCRCPHLLPTAMADPVQGLSPVPHQDEIAELNLRTARQALQNAVIVLGKYI